MALSLNETKSILSHLNVHPNRKLGQNFLIDTFVVERSVLWAQVLPGEVIVEIGPGCGTLTSGLVQAGAKVCAVEKDQAFYRYICEKFPIVDILHGDALETPIGRWLQATSPVVVKDEASIAPFPTGHKPAPTVYREGPLSTNCDNKPPFYKIVANLPYAIASVWLDKVLELPYLPERMVLLVQKEAANRWLAPSGCKHFCALGISLQAAYTCENSCNVSKRSFFPQPRVDSMLISLKKKPDAYIFHKRLKQWMRQVFIYRRKQIGHVCKQTDPMYALPFLAFLKTHHLSETLRADHLPLNLWLAFARM